MQIFDDIPQFEFKGLRIALAPLMLANRLDEAINEPLFDDNQRAKAQKAMLIVYHDDQADLQARAIRPMRVELYGTSYWTEACRALQASSNFTACFELIFKCDYNGCFFGARETHDEADWDELLNALFEFTLLEGRPVRSFKTTFLFPFILTNNKPATGVQCTLKNNSIRSMGVEADDVETALFFLPHIRAKLFGSNHSEPDFETVERYEYYGDPLTLHLSPKDADELKLPVSALRLLLFPTNHIYFLTFAVELPAIEAVDWDALATPLEMLFYLAYENGWNRIKKVQMQTCLKVNYLTRLIYPSYREQDEENKIADIALYVGDQKAPTAEFVKLKPAQNIQDKLQPALSPIISSMASLFLNTKKRQISPLLDDRMFINTHIALWGRKPESSSGWKALEALFSIALYVDLEGEARLEGYAYDPAFVKQRIQKAMLRRWQAYSGNLYGFTDYSNVYLGFDWFFRNITSRHIHNHYFYMLLLALYCRASIVNFSARLMYATYELTRNAGERRPTYNAAARSRINNLENDFVKFTHQYYHREITSQMQGIETYNHQYEAMHIDHVYAEFKEQLERVSSLLRNEWQAWVTRMSVLISCIGLFLAMVFGIVGASDKGAWAIAGVIASVIIALVAGVYLVKPVAPTTVAAIFKTLIKRIKS